MKRLRSRINNEKITVEKMVLLYCRKHYDGSPPCSECEELINYARLKLDQCKFGESKPACSKCSVHCYKPLMREQIRGIMRYSGPRMIYNHPLIAIRHMINKIIRNIPPNPIYSPHIFAEEIILNLYNLKILVIILAILL